MRKLWRRDGGEYGKAEGAGMAADDHGGKGERKKGEEGEEVQCELLIPPKGGLTF